MRTSHWLTLVFVCAACTPDVVVGINFRTDAGADDGGLSADAGFTDAGGLGDGGVDDGGALDAGTSDGGDAGLVDGGTMDSGTDAGVGDGGPVDLIPVLDGTVAMDQLELATYTAGVVNLGGSSALDASVQVTLPLGLTFRSSVRCTAAGNLITCPLGDVGPGSSTSANFTADSDAGPGWRDLSARALTSSADADAGNDSVAFFTGITAVSALTFPITAPRQVDIAFCVGAVTSFAQCTPASLVNGDITLLADGGLDGLDGGFQGQWAQSPHQRNLVFRFYAGSVFGARYCGFAASPTCFEGFIDSNGVYARGAFQACPR